MFRYLRFCFILLSIGFLSLSVNIPNFTKGVLGWYSQTPPAFSDWRGKPPCDWATNVPVAYFYTGKEPRTLRQSLVKEYWDSLQSDTLVVGIDGYALNLSLGLLPRGLIEAYRERLMAGEVIYFKAFKMDSLVYYKVMCEGMTP